MNNGGCGKSQGNPRHYLVETPGAPGHYPGKTLVDEYQWVTIWPIRVKTIDINTYHAYSIL